jgi:outer membrane lipoprotein-sorting protein
MLQMLDPLQQITRIRFSDVEVNLSVPSGKFSLVLPEGTDIIREDNG